MTGIPETRYARTPDGTYIAYQTCGDGSVDLVWQFDWTGNVDLAWEHPLLGHLLRGLASFSRLILHDRRGTGLSSRNVPPPNLETRVADLQSVLDTVGSTQPVLMGGQEGGAPNVLFAATAPERVSSIIWWMPCARSLRAPDYPWGLGSEYAEADLHSLEHWGTSQYGRAWAEAEAVGGHVVSEEQMRAEARLSRHTVTPDVARELLRIWYETDVRGVLPAVQTPALLITTDDFGSVEEASYIASLMPRAELRVIRTGRGPDAPDHEHLQTLIDSATATLEEVRRFVGVEPPRPELDTILSTVLFTDIVGSTERQAALGDHRWKDLVERHHAIVREALRRWRGVENDTAGDGFYATFDGPARSIRCALEVVQRVRELGIEIRAGVHTGECEVIEGKSGGLTVSIGARVASSAGPSEVLVSQTVKDLVAGSGFSFEDRGERELKGVPDRWRLFRVVGPEA